MSLQRRLHSRGSLSGPHAEGAYGISIHPLFPISSKYNCWRELAGAFFCVEGDTQAVEVFVPLLRELRLQVQPISAERKTQYHLSVRWRATLSVHSCSEAWSCWRAAASPKRTQHALAPLMRSNLAHGIDTVRSQR